MRSDQARACHHVGRAARSDDQFRAVFHAIAEGVVVHDLAGNIVASNPAAERMLGLSADDLRGRTSYDDRWHAVREDGTPFPGDEHPSMVTLRTGARLDNVVMGVRRPDDGFVWLSISSFPLRLPSGETYAVATSFRDETARKQIEDDLRRISDIVESSGDATYGTDLDGRIVNWNAAATQLYGYTATEVRGQHVGVLAPTERKDEVDVLLEATKAGRVTRDFHTVRQARDGGLVDVALTVAPVRNSVGEIVGKSVVARDIRDALSLKRALEHQALHDPLTGLPNRTLVADRLGQASLRNPDGGRPTTVLFVDLDHFKTINDAAGHSTGDAVLAEVAARLRAVVSRSDTVGRFGGDEFVIVCENCDEDQGQRVAQRILDQLRMPVEVSDRELFLTASIGIASAQTGDTETLFSRADAAMYAAKAEGRNRAVVFDDALGARVVDRLELAQDLRVALARDELRLYYQPVVELASGTTIAYETLARWQHPSRGDVPPATFIEIAEASNLIGELDKWALRTAVDGARQLLDAGSLPVDGHVAVNISAMNIGDGGIEIALRRALKQADVPASAIRLEVTETAVMADPENATRVLSRIRELGATVALDDFGTGYSSLTYLRTLPIDEIKIDRSFVASMMNDPDDLAITVSIIDLARSVRLPTVAEGVEDERQLALLRDLGCVAAQGFLWSPAVPLAALVESGSPAAPMEPRIVHRSTALEVRAEHGLARLMQLHHDGASLNTIAAALNREGFRTPRGMQWHRASVARVISDIVTRNRSRRPRRARSA